MAIAHNFELLPAQATTEAGEYAIGEVIPNEDENDVVHGSVIVSPAGSGSRFGTKGTIQQRVRA